MILVGHFHLRIFCDSVKIPLHKQRDFLSFCRGGEPTAHPGHPRDMRLCYLDLTAFSTWLSLQSPQSTRTIPRDQKRQQSPYLTECREMEIVLLLTVRVRLSQARQ